MTNQVVPDGHEVIRHEERGEVEKRTAPRGQQHRRTPVEWDRFESQSAPPHHSALPAANRRRPQVHTVVHGVSSWPVHGTVFDPTRVALGSGDLVPEDPRQRKSPETGGRQPGGEHSRIASTVRRDDLPLRDRPVRPRPQTAAHRSQVGGSQPCSGDSGAPSLVRGEDGEGQGSRERIRSARHDDSIGPPSAHGSLLPHPAGHRAAASFLPSSRPVTPTRGRRAGSGAQNRISATMGTSSTPEDVPTVARADTTPVAPTMRPSRAPWRGIGAPWRAAEHPGSRGGAPWRAAEHPGSRGGAACGAAQGGVRSC